MMEHIVSLLRRHGVTDIVVTVAFLPNAIRSYFGDGSELGVRMVYATEETPLGTAGSVRNARDELDERFLVISGDVLTDIDLTAVVEFHQKSSALATLALCSVDNPLEFGIVITREDGSVERFLEKPGWGQVFSDTINTGIYVLEPEIFDLIPEGRSVDFSSEVFPAALEAGKPVFGYVADGYWEDVGTTAAYLKAHQDILDGKVEVDMTGFELRPGVWLGKGSSVDPSARIDGPPSSGRTAPSTRTPCRGLHDPGGQRTDGRAGRGPPFGDRGERLFGAGSVRVEGSVLGRSCDLRHGARCEPGSWWGRAASSAPTPPCGATSRSTPTRWSKPGAQVNSSIVWESGGARTLFGREGVRGIANVDVSPELAVRLAKAWASTLEKGSFITTSRDTSRAARVLKRALMVGCNSVGVNVTDLEVATIPVTRHHIRTRGSQAGLTVRLSPHDPQSVVIRFFDDQGLDLSENDQRRIERLYHREEFRRVTAGDIGDIEFSPRAVEHYTADLVEAFGLRAVPRRDLKLVLDLSYGAGSFVMPNLLAKVGADVLSINPYAQTPGMIAVELNTSTGRVADTVRGSGADLGAVIDAGGEHLTLVDGTGRVLTNDEALMAYLELITAVVGRARVALPVTTSTQAEELCAARGTEVLATALSPSGLMEAAASGGVVFAADQEGGYIFPAFLPSFDAAAALVELIALLGRAGETLADVVKRVPEIPILHSEVETPFEQKGLVMRTLMEQMVDEEREVLLVDGIKVRTPDGWVLVVPDPEEPSTHIWAEGDDWAGSARLTEEYVDRMYEILR
jgi:mannose-1-phosphate guanylyltransferase/phosphomannomutase